MFDKPTSARFQARRYPETASLPLWDGIEIVRYFEDKFAIPTRLQNDANARAVAEWKYTICLVIEEESGKSFTSFVYP